MNRTVALVGVLIVVPLVVFLALGFRVDPKALDSPLVGAAAPQFELRSIDDETVSLAALGGTPVVLNFWASWCQPCIVEHPVLVDGARRYAGRVAFVGIIYQDELPPIRRYLALRGSWGPSLVDPGAEVALRYGVYGAPETFFIDKQGLIRRKVVGALSRPALDAYLAEVL